MVISIGHGPERGGPEIRRPQQQAVKFLFPRSDQQVSGIEGSEVPLPAELSCRLLPEIRGLLSPTDMEVCGPWNIRFSSGHGP